MTTTDFHAVIEDIVQHACELKDLHTSETNAPVNYACIFSHNEAEYAEFDTVAKTLGQVVKSTPTGLLYQIKPLETVAGPLQLVKIRKPDSMRPERGDADFTVPDYSQFKKTHLGGPGFQLIVRTNMEMIELIDPAFNVRAYFSHPPLDQELGLI